MKKLTAVFVCALFVLSLAACGRSDAEPIPAVGGIITDASMNSITLKNGDGVEYTFSTEDANKSKSKGLETGTIAWVYYTGSVSKDGNTSAATVTHVVQTEEKTLSGTVNEGTSMNNLMVDTEDGKTESFFPGAADMTRVTSLAGGKAVTVVYAENPEVIAEYQRIVLRVEQPEE